MTKHDSLVLNTKLLYQIANYFNIEVKLIQPNACTTDDSGYTKHCIGINKYLSSNEWKIAEILAHELGHFIVASSAERKQNDYGLPVKTPTEYSNLKEVKAQFVEVDLLLRCGFPEYGAKVIGASDYPEAATWWKITGMTKVRKIISNINRKILI